MTAAEYADNSGDEIEAELRRSDEVDYYKSRIEAWESVLRAFEHQANRRANLWMTACVTSAATNVVLVMWLIMVVM
jgi:hypothetical protein